MVLHLSEEADSRPFLVIEPPVLRAADPNIQGFEEILTSDALAFVGELVREFSPRLDALLQRRMLVHQSLRNGALPDFLDETREIRTSDWKVESIPADIRQRRVEITGPVDR